VQLAEADWSGDAEAVTVELPRASSQLATLLAAPDGGPPGLDVRLGALATHPATRRFALVAHSAAAWVTPHAFLFQVHPWGLERLAALPLQLRGAAQAAAAAAARVSWQAAALQYDSLLVLRQDGWVGMWDIGAAFPLSGGLSPFACGDASSLITPRVPSPPLSPFCTCLIEASL
jgi:hypothetical protein